MADRKKPFPAAPSMIGEKLYLRATTPEDIVNTHHWQLLSEPQALSCRPRPFRTAKEVAEAARAREKSIDRQHFVAVRKDDNAPVAVVGYFDYNSLNRSAELGLQVDPDERRKGYGSEAVRILVNYLFGYRGLNKVYAQTAGFNEAAMATMESLGFKRDATLRDHYFYQGEFHPGYIYSLLQFEVDW